MPTGLTKRSVSPTRASATDLICAAKYPTSPAYSASTGTLCGASTPTSSSTYSFPVFIITTVSPRRMAPSETRNWHTTPR